MNMWCPQTINDRKPIAKKPVSKKQNYNAKIAAYSRAEDKKVIDTYYKKYDESNQDQVKAIQAELVAKNFLPGPAAIDGKFGDKTKQAYLKYKTAERVGDLSGETEKSTCSYDGCAEYVSSVTRPYGWVLGDAWTMKNNIETNGGKDEAYFAARNHSQPNQQCVGPCGPRCITSRNFCDNSNDNKNCGNAECFRAN